MNRYYIIFMKFVLGCLVSLVVNLGSGSVFAEDVALYGVFETSLDYQTLTGTTHAYSDPFYGVDLEATFTSPSGKTITWWGFFDGDALGGQSGNIWKIRFMPDELGVWNFTWQFSDGSLSGTGSFQAMNNAVYPAKPGPLRHNTEIPQWLTSADGSSHVFLNMHRTSLITSTAFDDPNAHITHLKNNGFDVLYLSGAAGWYHKNQPKTASNPYPFTDTTTYIPRLEGWHYQENGLHKVLYDNNMYVYSFLGFYGGNNLYDLHAQPVSLQNKVIKYWLARTAPNFIFLYNIGFELQEFVSVPSWPAQRATYIKNIDPWDHLVTAHELHVWSYGNTPSIDFSALQNDDNFHGRGLAVWNSPSKPHPHCNECIWNAPWQAAGTEASHRKDLWDGMTAGMSYGFLAKDNEVGLTSFKHANFFLKNGVKWWTMAPHDEVVVSGTAYVLAKVGVEYIAYSASGGSVRLNIPSGSYQNRWFNPATGTYTAWAGLEAITGTSTLFNKPNSSDWVLQIVQGIQDTTAPSSPTGLVVK